MTGRELGRVEAETHAAVLAGLDRLADLADDAVLRGRRRIIERHAPYTIDTPLAGRNRGTWCEDHRKLGGPWPCADYRDAAADLLPEGGPTP